MAQYTGRIVKMRQLSSVRYKELAQKRQTDRLTTYLLTDLPAEDYPTENGEYTFGATVTSSGYRLKWQDGSLSAVGAKLDEINGVII